jgi:hypothetical protein
MTESILSSIASKSTKKTKTSPDGKGRDLFTRYDIIPYIKSAYDALHVMGGPAITGDIKSLIAGIRGNRGETV